MSELDVEALLDSTAATSTEQNGSSTTKPTRDGDDRHRTERNERRDRDRLREPSRDRKHRNRSAEIDEDAKKPGSEHGSAQGSQKSERRRSRSPRGGKGSRDGTPPLTEDERDKRTVFVQQLAARLRSKELIAFFEKVGPVKEAQIVKDRVSGRSKGVGYVEFKNEESVAAAIQLTGQKLLGIPIIAQLTEAEKNRQVRTTEPASNNPNQIPFHRLYVAREALEKMNGFDLAGRPIRVGLGNDKFTPESTASLLQRFQGQSHQQQFQGSAFSGAGGRGPQASGGGGGGGAFDRAGGRDGDKGTGGASALDDTDVGGVNFNNYSRDALMRKLARTDEPAPATNGRDDRREVARPRTEVKPPPINVNTASRCVVLRNMFDPAEETGENWEKELEDDVRAEAEEKYGHVVHISLDPNSQGDIYLKFDRVQGGENAIQGLNGRYFGGRMISATPVVDAVYSTMFSRTKAI
ncbi:hypothetical protein VE01_10651 [Pseudogymnoascus verrucosus]|uniref:RRM domain-containing protein n=1 Tax=Pseudogymnoascus verrucosus TaxID=342668 RepID=A0A1B8G693_9PEZI|nr:uncharacterized protein VE01_10651 [Pseudogymnoascus verrucosus]OBT91348.1 hypothetical protein VE01_10651 [Pseudogymnoascus verrucosus]